MGLKRLLLGLAAAALLVGCAHNKPRDENRWAGEKVEVSRPAKYEQALYVLPSAVCSILQHEASHALVAKWLGAQNIEARLYPSIGKNETEGFDFYWASVSHRGLGEPRKDAAVSLAGPLSNLVAAESLKLCLKQGLVGEKAEPFIASAALVNDLAAYGQLFWAPFNTDLADASKDLKINPWAWFGVGLAKLGYDVLIAHDTEHLVGCILGKRSYAKEKGSVVEPIFGTDGKNIYVGIGMKF